MSKETNTPEVKKSLPIKEVCLVLVGIILGIVISYGLFASAVKEAANNIEISTTAEDKSAEGATVDSETETTTNENATSEDETEDPTDESNEAETTSENITAESETAAE